MKAQRLFTDDIAYRPILVESPEPDPDLICGDPFEGAYLGRTRIAKTPVVIRWKLLANPNMVVVGQVGGGKSLTVKTVLTRAYRSMKINSIIIDFTGEYKTWVLKEGGRLVRLGKGDYLNPFDLAGLSPGERVEQIISMLDISSDLSTAPRQRRLMRKAFREAYKRRGYDPDLKEDQQSQGLVVPTFQDSYDVLQEWLEDAEGKASREDFLIGCMERIWSGEIQAKSHLSRHSTIKLGELITSGLVDIDLSGLPDERARVQMAYTLLQFLLEKMRSLGWLDHTREKDIRLFIVLDEAHKICGDEKSLAVSIYREGRKYQFAMIVATQTPMDISEVMLANCSVCIIHRLKSAKWADLMARNLNLPQRIRDAILGLGVGEAVVHLGFSERVGREAFLLKVDAEFPPQSLKIRRGGCEMDQEYVELSMQTVEETLLITGVSEEKSKSITKTLGDKKYDITLTQFISILDGAGMSRDGIEKILKQLEFTDTSIISAYHQLKENGKTGRSTRYRVVVLEGEA